MMRLFIWLFQLFCLLLLFYSQLTSSLYSQDQRSALLQFKQLFSFSEYASYHYCDQYSYPKMESWKEGTDCCSWDGVTCDRVRGDVIGLDLSCSWLEGTIPSNSSLFLLHHLQRLNLAFNNFRPSRISSGFGQFSRLRYLNLSCSNFFGQVPIELSHLSQLASLDLSIPDRRSSFFRDGVPLVMLQTSVVKSLLQNLTKLRELHLDHIDMSSVSLSSFMNLSSSLTSLALKDCQLNGTLPDSIFRLPNLRELSLIGNSELKGLFPMVNWTNPLRFLAVSRTLFSGELPKSIGNLKFLSYLGLSSCNFSKSLPATIGNLTQLTFFDLSYNNFSGEIPSSLSNLKALDCFDLQGNNLSGSIPASLGNLTKVTGFFLHSNNLIGQIPSSLSNLKDLASIDLSYNNFRGRIPDFLTNLTKLFRVDLSYNQLTQIGEFQPSNSLQYLTLNNNKLYGSIPKSISNLVNLSMLDISSNNLSGNVEFDLKELWDLDLSYNSRLSGIKSNLPALCNLNLGSCNITEFPNFLKSSKYLQHLDLSNNQIYNQVPEWMFEVGENLRYLNLSHNFLSSIDQLPWKNLEYLDLRANLLKGKFPVPPDSIDIFFISNNSLIGGIPSMICNASSLRVLDISHNSLGGTVPQCLGNFSNLLSVMDLRMNNFHGTIPDTFVKDNWLTTLAFNGNQLEGQLPKSLVNCTKLEVLDLGNNKINDFFPYWLEALPELKILVLKSNRFHGPIGNHKTSGNVFSKLRILDLSHNEFTGLLPRNYFQNLSAMMSSEGENLKYLGEMYYQDSVVVTMKGLEIKLERILNIFTTIDLSSNKFEGEIPDILGRLTILRLLNLSHNSLTGHIPLSLANLSALESIDLSSNKLTGEIPMQLTSLTFLAMLNLSRNQLIGPIPKGKQFDTFENDSYDGNLGLCGFPLSIKCRTDEPPPPPLPSIFQEDNDSIFASGFGWKAVLIGYGCGLLFGLVMGFVMFKVSKPQWLVRFVEGEQIHKIRRPNNQRARQRRN